MDKEKSLYDIGQIDVSDKVLQEGFDSGPPDSWMIHTKSSFPKTAGCAFITVITRLYCVIRNTPYPGNLV